MTVDYDGLAAAIKKRDVALAGRARWQEKVDEAEAAIAGVLAGDQLSPLDEVHDAPNALPADYADAAQ